MKKGRLRTDLRVCVDSFVSNENKAGRRKKRGGDIPHVALDFAAAEDYCMAGNQPTMRGTYSPETNTLTFEMVSITNLQSANDGHMHHATYTFLDKNHFKTTWTFRKDQKDAFVEM